MDNGRWTMKHNFSLSSSPTEDFLQFTTKYRRESEYKKALWSKKPGDLIEIRGPFGEFVLDTDDRRPRILIAGGIGITPFRSMLRYSADKKLDLPTTLLYSVKNRAEGAFAAELQNLSIINSQLSIKFIETEKEGRLNAQKIKSYCPSWRESTVWLCGPPAMVEAIMEIVSGMGWLPEAIKSEEFTGY